MKKGNLKLTFIVVAAILNFEIRSQLIQGLELHLIICDGQSESLKILGKSR